MSGDSDILYFFGRKVTLFCSVMTILYNMCSCGDTAQEIEKPLRMVLGCEQTINVIDQKHYDYNGNRSNIICSYYKIECSEKDFFNLVKCSDLVANNANYVDCDSELDILSMTPLRWDIDFPAEWCDLNSVPKSGMIAGFIKLTTDNKKLSCSDLKRRVVGFYQDNTGYLLVETLQFSGFGKIKIK